jgi:chemotaxis protein MotB
MKRRKINDEDAGGHERWLLSYADFITLLFAFFVVMYASSSLNKSKYQQVTDALSQAFDKPKNKQDVNQISGLSNSGGQVISKPFVDDPLAISKAKKEKIKAENKKINILINALVQALSPMINTGKIKVMQTSKGVRIDIHDSVLFAPGSAHINNQDAMNTLQLIAPLLNSSGQAIEIEGHTDNIPIKNLTFASNWELSAIRATSVLNVFSQSGIADERLSAIGYGASRPVDSNESDVGRASNRRVSIMILRDNR